jgi:cyclic pyranopterin phosphate synthase
VSGELSHIDERGHAVMVDVTAKDQTLRRAEVRGKVVRVGDLSGVPGGLGELLASARAAGLLAAKQTSSLIPLCHPLPLRALSVDFEVGDDEIGIVAVAETLGQTGVEMEALCACTVAALSIVSVLSPRRRGVAIEDLALWQKSGGRSGSWLRSDAGTT